MSACGLLPRRLPSAPASAVCGLHQRPPVCGLRPPVVCGPAVCARARPSAVCDPPGSAVCARPSAVRARARARALCARTLPASTAAPARLLSAPPPRSAVCARSSAVPPRPARPHAGRPHASRQHSRALPPLCGAICARPCLRPPLPPPSPRSLGPGPGGPGVVCQGREVVLMNAKITSSRLDNEQSRFAFFDSQYKFAWCNGARNGAMVPFRKKTPDCAGQRCSVEDDDVDSKKEQ